MAKKASKYADDKAEKKRRRKTLIEDKKRRETVYGYASSDVNSIAKHKLSRLETINPDTLDSEWKKALSQEELHENYESWMKIAADNKINTNNSWTVQLIDYFHELSLMREGDSINFQKASCTLDGCVKVYSTRVDAVASETNRLLTGLAENPGKQGKNMENVNNSGEGEEEVDEDYEGEDGRRKPKRKPRSGNTIEKNLASINLKKFDLECTVDPLFKKTSADFDEGGACGLLLNHLSVYGAGKIVFDAGDVDAGGESNYKDTYSKYLNATIPFGEVLQFWDSVKSVDHRSICPSLSGFKFTDRDCTLGSLMKNNERMKGDNVLDDLEHTQPVDIPFMGDNDDMDSDIDIIEYGVSDGGSNGVDNPSTIPAVYQQSETDLNNFDDDMKARDLSISLGVSSGPYSYFDTTALKNWAGPQHWKVHRFKKKPRETDGIVEKKSKKEKQSFSIDFFSKPTKDEQKLFLQDTKGSTLMSIKSKDDSWKTLLPKDMHYSYKDLSTLFLKPAFNVLKSVSKTQSLHSIDDNQNIEYNGVQEENYHDFSDHGDIDDDDGYDENHNGHSIISHGTTFYFNGPDANGLVDAPKMTRVEAINYAKKAKKVDVKQLKDRMWDNMTKASSDHNNMENNLKLTEIISDVSATYPSKKASEITTPFYFICLLHLANEKHLEIKNNDELSELMVRQTC